MYSMYIYMCNLYICLHTQRLGGWQRLGKKDHQPLMHFLLIYNGREVGGTYIGGRQRHLQKRS
jgi:hypothetical protein